MLRGHRQSYLVTFSLAGSWKPATVTIFKLHAFFPSVWLFSGGIIHSFPDGDVDEVDSVDFVCNHLAVCNPPPPPSPTHTHSLQLSEKRDKQALKLGSNFVPRSSLIFSQTLSPVFTLAGLSSSTLCFPHPPLPV